MKKQNNYSISKWNNALIENLTREEVIDILREIYSADSWDYENTEVCHPKFFWMYATEFERRFKINIRNFKKQLI
jgi:hypothetical protein